PIGAAEEPTPGDGARGAAEALPRRRASSRCVVSGTDDASLFSEYFSAAAAVRPVESSESASVLPHEYFRMTMFSIGRDASRRQSLPSDSATVPHTCVGRMPRYPPGRLRKDWRREASRPIENIVMR